MFFTLFIVSGKAGDFKCLFRKIRHHFLWSLMNFQADKRPALRCPYSLFMRRRFWRSYPLKLIRCPQLNKAEYLLKSVSQTV